MSERLFDRYPFLGIKHLQKNKSSLPRPIEKKTLPKPLLKNRPPTGSHSGATAQTASAFERATPEYSPSIASPWQAVLLEREHDLGGAVPPCRDVFGHEPRLGARGLGGLDGPRQLEITRFEMLPTLCHYLR